MVCPWYSTGMSTQMTVRIPDDVAGFVDAQVAAGAAASRAEVIATALRHEQRRLAAQRDAAIYAAAGSDADMDALTAWTAAQPMGLD
jgi:Arc/MetJ-type ribon-helix-helix transcriptional regulator